VVASSHRRLIQRRERELSSLQFVENVRKRFDHAADIGGQFVAATIVQQQHHSVTGETCGTSNQGFGRRAIRVPNTSTPRPELQAEPPGHAEESTVL
jgi:hypothetical protein